MNCTICEAFQVHILTVNHWTIVLISGVDPAAANASTTVITTNNASGIEAMCPSSKDDFVAFEKLLKDKITQFEKSVHYSSFLESLFRELCISCKCGNIFLLVVCVYFNNGCLWQRITDIFTAF